MKSTLPLTLATMLMAGIAGGAVQTSTEISGGRDAKGKAAQAALAPAPIASHGRSDESRLKTSASIDADSAYKANCSRCHLAPRKFNERKTATIIRHMRVRANLTKEEAAAIFRYLTQ